MRPPAATPALLALALSVLSLPLTAAVQPDDCLAARRQETSREAACYSLLYDGRKRTLRVYLPPGRSEPLPVMLVLHGGGGTGGGMDGRVSQALDANETIWAFFRQHALR